MMGKKRRVFTREFKVAAVKLVSDEGYSFAEAAESLGVHESLLRKWKQKLETEGDGAFPRNGKVRALEAEVKQLRAEN